MVACLWSELASGFMSTNHELVETFRALHAPGTPLLIPNPWDPGSARVLQTLGFKALATTSGGFAGTLGHRDGNVTRDQAVGHGAQVAEAVEIPVSADLESGFASDAAGVAETVRLASLTGLAGCSIEDYDPDTGTMHPIEIAAERVAAAAEAAHSGPGRLVLTARADNHLRGFDDLDDTIARLQAYEAAGADVLYAPVVSRIDDIRRILDAVSLPINVLALPDAPSVAELADAGVARISIGTGFFNVAMASLVTAGREFLDEGTYGFWDSAAAAHPTLGEAFS